jgi:hypothetical protein
MKIKQVDTPVEFKPVTFEVTIESLRELADLYGRSVGPYTGKMPEGYAYSNTLADFQGHIASLCRKYGILK